MTYAKKLHAAALDNLGPDWLHFFPRWDVQRRCPWQGEGGVPDALMLHHSAAVGPGVVPYIQSHYEVPAANWSIERDGLVNCHSAYPIWHAGLGSFRGRAPWNQFKIPDNRANDYTMGVELIDLGAGKTITAAQKDSLVHLLRSIRDASGWVNIGLARRPQHRDWAPNRKVDLRYSNAEVSEWIMRYGFAQAA